jgi:hypothetical protein
MKTNFKFRLEKISSVVKGRSPWLRTTFALCAISLFFYSCKKDGNVADSDGTDAAEILEIARKSYDPKKTAHRERFDINWENYYLQGDSVLVVETKGLKSLRPDRTKKGNVAMVSGMVFRLLDKKVVNIKMLEFYGDRSTVKSSGLKILSTYGKPTTDRAVVAEGTFVQYSPRSHRRMGGLAVMNGVANKNAQVSQRMMAEESLQGGNNCEPVYLIVYVIQTGQIISQTFLYDACDEEGDSAEDVIYYAEEEVNDCTTGGEVIQFEEAGEGNSVEVSAEVGNTRTAIYDWVFIRNALGFWDYRSKEKGFHKKVGTEWRWENIEHLSTGLSGVTPAAEITISDFIFVPTIGIYNAGGVAHFNFKSSVLCAASANPIKGISRVMKINSPIWNVDEVY